MKWSRPNQLTIVFLLTLLVLSGVSVGAYWSISQLVHLAESTLDNGALREQSRGVLVLVVGGSLLIYGLVIVTNLVTVRELAQRRRVEELLQQTRDDLEEGVRERTAELATANDELEELIAARVRADAEVRRLNAQLEARVLERTSQLEAANRELEAFSYSVSHDLRAPLRSIDGFSQALLEDYGDQLDAVGRDYLDRSRAATQRMAQLIDDMLNLSRVTRSEMYLAVVDLTAMAHSIIAELQQTTPGRAVEICVADNVTATGDARLLRVALENLLGNSWKFTAKHATSRIEFATLVQNGETVYLVRDDGAGFDMAYADKLFRAFQRLHAMTEFPGTGVGLATVQRVIHRHGGRVWAEGRIEAGAAFYFTLPDRAPPLPRKIPAESAIGAR